jgi:hypothetical protein
MKWGRQSMPLQGRLFTTLWRKFVAVTASLLITGPLPGNVIALGTVTHAERAHVGAAAASVGSTIYEGDRLSTEVGGRLRLTGSAVTLQLGAQSSLTVRRSVDPGGNILADLASGTLVFSAAPSAGITVIADGVSVRPVGKASTIAHIGVVSTKELLILARRGSVELSYHGDSQVIPEGKRYRVLLDPSEKEIDAALGSDQDQSPPARPRRTFLLVAIVITAGITIPFVIHALESPDRP